ncbi:hypothetical protein LCGC14_1349710, partial [marine sediment metagenome]
MQQASKVTPLKRSRPAKVPARRSSPPKPRLQEVRTAPVPSTSANVRLPDDAWGYGIDVWQRTILFWDTLRQRADNMLEHERAGL